MNDFCGELTTKDARSAPSIYIRVSDDEIRLYNAPPPFKIETLVGSFGSIWRIKRIKRGFFLSTFIITFIEENVQIEYLAGNKFGDMLEQAIKKRPTI